MSEHVADNKGKELLKNEIKELKRLKKCRNFSSLLC